MSYREHFFQPAISTRGGSGLHVVQSSEESAATMVTNAYWRDADSAKYEGIKATIIRERAEKADASGIPILCVGNDHNVALGYLTVVTEATANKGQISVAKKALV